MGVWIARELKTFAFQQQNMQTFKKLNKDWNFTFALKFIKIIGFIIHLFPEDANR